MFTRKLLSDTLLITKGINNDGIKSICGLRGTK